MRELIVCPHCRLFTRYEDRCTKCGLKLMINITWVCSDCGSVNPQFQLKCKKCGEIRLNSSRDIPIRDYDMEYKPRTEHRELIQEKYGDKNDI